MMNTAAGERSSVYYTGVPVHIEEAQLRRLFSNVGHIVGFRLLGPDAGRDFRHGVVDYGDGRTAQEAIARLNGTAFGEATMRVTLTTARPQRHHHRGGGGGGDHRERYDGDRKRRRFDGPRREDLLTFPRGFVDPVLRTEGSPVLRALYQMPTAEAYEAVEELRALALEHPAAAKQVLENNPALVAAVVCVMQHAGRLPMGPLPSAAFLSAEERAAAAAPQAPPPAPPTAPAAAEAAAAESARAQQQREEILRVIESLSEADVERITTMTDADLAKVTDTNQRRQLELLRNRLREMMQDL